MEFKRENLRDYRLHGYRLHGSTATPRHEKAPLPPIGRQRAALFHVLAPEMPESRLGPLVRFIIPEIIIRLFSRCHMEHNGR